MSQLARISRGVRAALGNHQSMFLIEKPKRASSTYHGGLPNYWLKKSNPWKSYLNPNGITNPRPPFSPSSSSSSLLPYKTSTDKGVVTSKGKDKDKDDDQVENDVKIQGVLLDYDELLSTISSVWVWDLFCPRSSHAQDNPQRVSTMSCTKVYKQGIAYGTVVDLTKYNGFDELIAKLDQMFEFNGELISMFEFNGELIAPSKSWLVLYSDDNGALAIVGGDWQDFCNDVRSIFIYTREEVEKRFRRRR